MTDHNLTFPEPSLERRHTRFAVVMFLPSRLDQAVQPLRERFDPLYNRAAAHITVVFPFETTIPLHELTDRIRGGVRQRPPLSIRLTTVGDFYPQAPVIYWKVDATQEICDLYYRLYAALDMPIPYKQYIPHVTIGREISSHRVVIVKDKIASYVREERYEAAAIDLITLLVNHRWVSVRTFNLSGSGESA